jgi:hypothetical protein
MSVEPDDPGAGPRGQRLNRLLRWYPRGWRERYGEEFLALVEDTLDGGRPGWRLHLGVIRAGLRERGRRAVPAAAGATVAGAGALTQLLRLSRSITSEQSLGSPAYWAWRRGQRLWAAGAGLGGAAE